MCRMEETDRVIPRIVVCGDTLSGKKSLVKGIMQLDQYLAHHPTVTSSSSSSSSSSNVSSSASAITINVPEFLTHTLPSLERNGSDTTASTVIHTLPWNIRTKYYSADIEWYILPSSEFLHPTELSGQLFTHSDDDNKEKNNEEQYGSTVSRPIEALILIVDPSARKLPLQSNPSSTDTSPSSSSPLSPPSSLSEVLSAWLTIIHSHNNPPPCLLLLSNKIDILTQKIPGTNNNNNNNNNNADNRSFHSSFSDKPVSYGSMDTTATAIHHERSESTIIVHGNDNRTDESNNHMDNEDAAVLASSSTPVSSTDPELLQYYRNYTTFIQDWCLDNGFEHIEMVATVPLAGAHNRDKVNVPRVLEALQSNMWSNMERTKISTNSIVSSSLLPSSSTSVPSSFSSTQTEEKHESSSSSSSAASKRSKPENFFEAMRKAAETGEKNGKNENDDGIADEDDEEEEEDIDIGALMEEMQRVRNQAQSGNLSDEARREAASRMIMKLYSVLGGGDDKEDEEAK